MNIIFLRFSRWTFLNPFLGGSRSYFKKRNLSKFNPIQTKNYEKGVDFQPGRLKEVENFWEFQVADNWFPQLRV